MGELDEAMCEAIALGERAGKQGDVPVGAVVLDERGTVIGRGRGDRGQRVPDEIDCPGYQGQRQESGPAV